MVGRQKKFGSKWPPRRYFLWS